MTVQIVNDTDTLDASVYLLLTGTVVSVGGNIQALQLPQAVPPSGDVSLQVALTWTSSAPPPTGATFSIAGSTLVPTIGNQAGTNATVNGSAGLSSFPLLIQDGDEILYGATSS